MTASATPARKARRTRRTFPVTVTFQAPKPVTPMTGDARRTAIFAPSPVSVTKAGGGKF